jgi:ferritin-like metal-binding protein YciE
MDLESLKGLYIQELKGLYSAEEQMVKALRRLAKAATNDDLVAGFEEHLEQTKEHAERLEKILESHDESTRGPKCKGMQGLIKESTEIIEGEPDDDIRDVGLISAAQRAEHYEIAGCGCAHTYAEMLGDDKGAALLDSMLEEEGETDQRLTQLAKSVINIKAPRK